MMAGDVPLQPPAPSLLVVLGATGFLGRQLLAAARARGWPVRALARSELPAGAPEGVDWVQGDVHDPEVWSRLLTAGCTVVNLAHAQRPLGGGADAIQAMARACAQAGVARLVHCSSISVYGRSAYGVVDEHTPCLPADAYGCDKLQFEANLLAAASQGLEVTVLRPAAVFGPGGEALRSLAASLAHGSGAVNLLRAALFGRRQMHLVPASTVVDALCFLSQCDRPVGQEAFIVAADDEPLNNFRAVESLLRSALGLPARQVPALPTPLLRLALRLRGRSATDPACRYSMAKLRKWGFEPTGHFEVELRAYVGQLAGAVA